MPNHRLCGVAAIAALVAALPAAATTSYHLVDLGPDAGSTDINRKGEVAGFLSGSAALYTDGAWRAKNDRHHGSTASAIDDAGNMVGEEQDRDNVFHLMYYPKGAKDTPIPVPEGAGNIYGYPFVGISPDGRQVAGTYRNDADGYDHCFVWHPGEATSIDIGLPAGYDTCTAIDVNDSGEVVGQVLAAGTSSLSGFIYKDGAFSFVGSHPSATAYLSAINKKGHAIGFSYKAEAVYWNGRHLRRIPDSGDLKMTEADAVNDRDEIVGAGMNGRKDTLMKFADGVLVDLVPMIDNAEGWHFSPRLATPTGINDRGEISGNAFYVDDAGVRHYRGYVLVPND